MSIEFPATSSHCHNMTERLLKAMLSPNQTNAQEFGLEIYSGEVTRKPPQQRFSLLHVTCLLVLIYAATIRIFQTIKNLLSAQEFGLEVYSVTSRKHTYIILTPSNPTFIKTGVYRGIRYFSYFCSKHGLWVLVRTASVRRF